MQILCILAALLLAAPASAKVLMPTAIEIAKSLPPEMLWQGKPLSPACVDASNPSEGESVEQDLNTCDTPPEGWTIMGGLRAGPYQSLSYDYGCPPNKAGTELCGTVGYRYLGMTANGPALQTMSGDGASPGFSSIIVVRRKGDKFTTDMVHPFGDRCDGGVLDAQVTDGKIEYTYNATAEQLYKDYKSGEGKFGGYRTDMTDCMAVVSAVDGTVRSIELNRAEDRLVKDPACAAAAYRAQFAEMKSLTEDQFRAFIVKIENACQQ